MQLPGSATWPAADSRRLLIAQQAGQRIVALVEERPAPAQILTRAAFENAIVGQRGDRRVDQRRHPPARPRRAARRPARPRRLRRAGPAGAHPGQPHALRPVPDGGLLLRRAGSRPCCASSAQPAERRDQVASPARHRREHRRRRVLEPGGHPDASPSRCSRPASAPRCCAATCARTGRSSSSRRRPASAQAPRPGAGVRLDRGLPRPWRTTPSCDAERVDHPRRPRAPGPGLPGDARGRQLRAAAQAPARARASPTWCASPTPG